MQFRRNGQGGDRRRRVLRDDVIGASDSDNDEAARLSRDDVDGRVYSDAALAQRQAPLTSLLPQRPLTLCALFLAGGLCIAGIQLLYSHLFINLPEAFQQSLVAFDVTARGSIASWFAATTLFIGAATSTLVYVIRRHRLDDYRGRYRMWQWATAAFVLGSFDAATGLHAILQPSMIQLTGTTLHANGSVWIVSLVGLAIGCCLVRLAIEIRGSRLTMFFLIVAATSYIAFAVTQFHPAIATVEVIAAIAGSSTLLAGHFCLVYAVAIYGRHVYQEAQGTRRAGRTRPVVTADDSLKEPQPKPARHKRTSTTKKSSTRKVRVDAAHEKSAPEPTPTATPTISKKTVRSPVAEKEEPDFTEAERPMSKAERRRLKKLQRRQRRQDASND